MGKNQKIIYATALVVMVSSLIWTVLRPREPQFGGRSVNEWLRDLDANNGNGYEVALREIGTNALPYGVAALTRNDSEWRHNYRVFQWRISEPLKLWVPDLGLELNVIEGGRLIYCLGPSVIPHARRLLKHNSPSVRCSAALGIYALLCQSNAPASDIISELDGMEADGCGFALLMVGQTSVAVTNAIPSLTSILSGKGEALPLHTNLNLRATAAMALGRIGPAARSALPTLKAVLQEKDSRLRGDAAIAIWRISGNIDITLPVLLEELPRRSLPDELDWVIGLGEMGPRAQATAPLLKKKLQLIPNTDLWVVECVTNSLSRIETPPSKN